MIPDIMPSEEEDGGDKGEDEDQSVTGKNKEIKRTEGQGVNNIEGKGNDQQHSNDKENNIVAEKSVTHGPDRNSIDPGGTEQQKDIDVTVRHTISNVQITKKQGGENQEAKDQAANKESDEQAMIPMQQNNIVQVIAE
ncbi:hypothetical protein A4A49_61155, partial [Nicotiana attenuata]